MSFYFSIKIKLGDRVSFILALSQELVSTPSCLKCYARQARLGVILCYVKELFFV